MENTFQVWTDYKAVDAERRARTAQAGLDTYYAVHILTNTAEGAVYSLAEHDTETTKVRRYVREGE